MRGLPSCSTMRRRGMTFPIHIEMQSEALTKRCRPPQLSSHVHDSRNDGGELASNVCRYRPIAICRKIQTASSAGQNNTRSPRVLGFRTQHEEHGREAKGDGGKQTAPRSHVEATSHPITQYSSAEATYRHRDERHHRVRRAGPEIQAPHLREINIEPGKEKPRDITARKVTCGKCKYLFTAENSRPRYRSFRHDGGRACVVSSCSNQF